MTKFHPFFIIGTVGMIITAVLHMILALGLSLTTVHTAFFIIYPTFVSFLVIGLGLTIKKQKESVSTYN